MANSAQYLQTVQQDRLKHDPRIHPELVTAEELATAIVGAPAPEVAAPVSLVKSQA